MGEVFRMIQETLSQERRQGSKLETSFRETIYLYFIFKVISLICDHQNFKKCKNLADKFITAANSVGISDRHLDVVQASDSVRGLLAEHERRFGNITESWEQWQRNRAQQKSVIRVVEEVMDGDTRLKSAISCQQKNVRIFDQAHWQQLKI